MGLGVTIHGIIEAPAVILSDLRVYRHNRAVLEELPEKDPDFLMTRTMFSLPPYHPETGATAPQYDEVPIHFAANYKEMLLLPAAWIHKFEQLLMKLFWHRAIVYHEFVGIRYLWRPSEGFQHDPLNPKNCVLTCQGIGNLTTVPCTVAIEGEYVPIKIQ
jgi:hypothetical protein